MNKRILGLISIIVLMVVGGAVFLFTSSSDKVAKQEMVDSNTGSSTQAIKDKETSNRPGSYVDYSRSAIADNVGTKLLFFHAPWCPQCRALDADIKSKSVPSGVVIIKVDYDTNQSLRQKYGVTLQTTIVRVDDQGNAVSKFVAYDDPSLSAIEKNLL